MRERPSRQLPVRLPPFTDELLSSWLCRHASFYAVPPLVMLQHCLPEVTSLRAADLDLSAVSGQSPRERTFHRARRGARHDVRHGQQSIPSIDRREAIAVLPPLSSRSLGLQANPAKPAARMAHDVPVMWGASQRSGRPRSRFPVPQISASCASWRTTARRRSGAWQMDLGLPGRYCSLASDASRAKASA